MGRSRTTLCKTEEEGEGLLGISYGKLKHITRNRQRLGVLRTETSGSDSNSYNNHKRTPGNLQFNKGQRSSEVPNKAHPRGE